MKAAVPLTVKLLLLLATTTTLLIFPVFTDPVNLPKFIFLISTAFSLAYYARAMSIQLSNKFDSKRFLRILNFHPITLSLIVFLISLLASSIFSESPLIGVFGLSGRRNGFLTYLALFALYLVAFKLASRSTLIHFLIALAVSGTLQSLYMLLQFLGLDPIPWDVAYENRMFGTLGNPNFSSAFLAISLPAIIFCTWSKSLSKNYRVFFGFGIVFSLSALYLAKVYQGPLSLAIAVFSMLMIRLSNSSCPRGLRIFLQSFMLLGATVFALGAINVGPLKFIFLKSSFQLRANGYWPIAAELGLSNPFLGVGSEQFVNYFARTVDLESRLHFGQMIPDNAHNFVLHFFAEGGFLVAVSYVFFFLLVSLSLVRVYRRLDSEDKYLPLAFIGVWSAFIGQSLVSIDNMGISVWIWILAGLIAATNYKTKILDASLKSSSANIVAPKRVYKEGKGYVKTWIAALISFGIISSSIQLLLLDNKVWVLENARKMPETSVVTETDLRTLLSRSENLIVDPILLSRASSLLLTYGVQEQGFQLLDRTISLNPASPSLYNLKAVATESMIGRAAAVSIRFREQEMDPWNSASSLELIRDLVDQKNFSAAKKELSRMETFADESFINVAKSLFPDGLEK